MLCLALEELLLKTRTSLYTKQNIGKKITFYICPLNRDAMKTLTFILLYSAACVFNCIAQSDTIYTNTEKIPCTVKEVTADAVKFIYPNEEIINTVYKNTIQKIVFKSGRVQTFAEATNYKTVNGATEYE